MWCNITEHFSFDEYRIRKAVNDIYNEYEDKTHSNHYFNLKCEHNFDTLNSYLNALGGVMERYQDVMDEFQNLDI